MGKCLGTKTRQFRFSFPVRSTGAFAFTKRNSGASATREAFHQSAGRWLVPAGGHRRSTFVVNWNRISWDLSLRFHGVFMGLFKGYFVTFQENCWWEFMGFKPDFMRFQQKLPIMVRLVCLVRNDDRGFFPSSPDFCSKSRRAGGRFVKSKAIGWEVLAIWSTATRWCPPVIQGWFLCPVMFHITLLLGI